MKISTALATIYVIALTGPCVAEGFATVTSASPADKPVVAEPVSYNGYSCDMVRAKVAESGVAAAYAYARYMGLSSRDISRVRKACAV